MNENILMKNILVFGIITLLILSSGTVFIDLTDGTIGTKETLDNKTITDSSTTLSYVDSSTGLPTSGQWPYATRIGDINNDGYLDIIRLRGHDDFNSEDQGFQIWLGDGTGSWSKASIPNGNFGYGGTAIGDFNNDGYLDAAYGVHHNRNHPLIGAWAGDGGTSFTEKSNGLATDGETYGMAPIDFGDFNNDGYLDIGVGSFGSGNGLRAYLNSNGGDSWQSKSMGLPYGGNVGDWLIWSDLNQDGLLDIIASCDQGVIWLGDGTGNWTANDFGLPYEWRDGLDVGDVNNDGWLDITFIKHMEVGDDDWYVPVVYLFDGTGWIGASDGLPNASNYPEITFAPLAFGDLDNDGCLDLVGLEGYRTGSWPNYYDWTDIHAWLGDGTGSWTEIDEIDTGITGWPKSVTLADIDHNNYLDIVISSDRDDYEPGGIRVYKETTPADQLDITLRQPLGGDVFVKGGVRVLKWTTSVPTGTATVALHYSITGDQGPWYNVVENITDSNYYQWIIPNVNTINGFIKATVYWNGQSNSSVNLQAFTILGDNTPPEPPVIEGPTSGKIDEEYEYTVVGTDPDGNMVQLFIDWGDDINSGWIGPYTSGEQVIVNHSWDSPGTYYIKVKAKDEHGVQSAWSDPLLVNISAVELAVEITGGIGVNVLIRNIGDVDAHNVHWHINITGGILGKINLSAEDTADILPPDGEIPAEIPFVIGLGPLEVVATISASNAGTVSEAKKGLILLFFVLLQ